MLVKLDSHYNEYKGESFMDRYLKMTREGFTLVELMVVVAIIGILASIAIPQYSKFQAKARQSEVRIQLGATYTVEQSFAAENSTYTGCLGNVGYNRDGTKFYYTVGFGTGISATAACIPGGGSGACTTYQWSYANAAYAVGSSCTGNTALTDFFAANISEPNAPKGAASAANDPTSQGDITTSSISSTAFVIGAAGKILSKATNVDQWTIDNNKQILNTTSGLQ